jgi:signal transduction histidine kinase
VGTGSRRSSSQVTPRTSFLYSLQFKLILAFSFVVLVALVLAGSVFVAVRRGEARDAALDHVVAASPPVYSGFTFRQRDERNVLELIQYTDAAAQQLDLRILMVERESGTVAYDTAESLVGQDIVIPEDGVVPASQFRPYVSWQPKKGEVGDDLVMVMALASITGTGPRLPSVDEEPYWLVLAVQKDTIRSAWRGLLPQLGLAAAIALPLAIIFAMVLANYISRPLAQLTTASQRVAEGDYDVNVDIHRRDEVGQLAKSFSTMATRVGETHSQMRALIANVSHDLKSPLTSILGFSQALRDGRAGVDEDTRHMGDVIHNEASRLSARLNDLLYLAELESGQSVLQRDEIDLRRLVASSVARVEDDVRERGVDLNVQLAEATISADGAKLERAVENLLDNARKYTPGGGEIDVALSPNGQNVTIAIANTARDISEDELPRLFERFYRRERARGEKAASGSGLGLAIARDLVEMHGGRLEADLRDGQLAFTMILPRGGTTSA